jgi:hypothetical protein
MPHGMMEYWNTGFRKREMILSKWNVEYIFFDDTHQAAISCFCHAKHHIMPRHLI